MLDSSAVAEASVFAKATTDKSADRPLRMTSNFSTEHNE
jgi:hypothetical protein